MRGQRTIVGLALAVGLAVAAAPQPAVGARTATVAKPTNFKISVNGRTLTTAQLNAAADTYMTVPTGRLTIKVRWTTDLRGTGHRVIITPLGGATRRRCVTGTSCVYATSWKLAPAQESSWSVFIYKGTRLLSEKALCFVGKS